MKLFPVIIILICFGCNQESTKNKTVNPENFWGTDLNDILIEKAPKLNELSYAVNLDELKTDNNEPYDFEGNFKEIALYKKLPFTGVSYILNDNGLIIEISTFKDGKLFGDSKLYDENGFITYKSFYFNNVENGPFQSYTRNSSNKVYLHQEGFKVNGMWEGILLEYHENGEIWKKSYYHINQGIEYLFEYDTLGNIAKIIDYEFIPDGLSLGTTVYQTFESASHDGSIPDYILKSKLKTK